GRRDHGHQKFYLAQGIGGCGHGVDVKGTPRDLDHAYIVLHDPIADLVPDLKATPLHNLPLNLWISQRILPSLIFLVALRLHIVARLSRWNQAVLSGQDRYTRGDGRRCRRRDAEARGTIHPFEENFVLYSIRMDKENRMSQLYVPVVLRNTREY